MRFGKTIRLNSLGLKVLLTYVAGILLTIVLVVIAGAVMIERNVPSGWELTDHAESMAQRLRFDANGKPTGFDFSEDDMQWLYDSLPHESAHQVLDADGTRVLISNGGEAFWPAHGAPVLVHGGFAFERAGARVLVASERIEHAGRVWFVQFAASERLTNLIHHKFALPFLGLGFAVISIVLILAFGLCAYVTLVYALKPLRDISKSAAAISPRSLHERLDTASAPSEIGPLVDSFNHALDRLELGYRLQQEFLANAAHELKTPLALIRAQIELPDNGRLDREALLGDVDYMTRQVQQLLLLAEASAAHSYSFGSIAVAEVAHEAVSFLQRMAEAAGVRVVVSGGADQVRWRADHGALFTLLKNLLENAIQHAFANTDVHVDIQRDAFSVRDEGPGVEAALLPRLFDRFWRGVHRRDHGAGLGLAICQEIAMAHGWQLSVERTKPGLRFRVSNTDVSATLRASHERVPSADNSGIDSREPSRSTA